MCKTERRGDGYCTAAETTETAAGNGGNHRPFTVRAVVDDNYLTSAEACRAVDRDIGCARVGSSAHRGAACRADHSDDGSLTVRAAVNDDCLADAKVRQPGDFDRGL